MLFSSQRWESNTIQILQCLFSDLRTSIVLSLAWLLVLKKQTEEIQVVSSSSFPSSWPVSETRMKLLTSVHVLSTGQNQIKANSRINIWFHFAKLRKKSLFWRWEVYWSFFNVTTVRQGIFLAFGVARAIELGRQKTGIFLLGSCLDVFLFIQMNIMTVLRRLVWNWREFNTYSE